MSAREIMWIVLILLVIGASFLGHWLGVHYPL